MAAGVAYWQTDDDRVAGFGKLWVRHATGQSFTELIDPSPEALEKLEGKEAGFEYAQAFWDEKQIPNWMRFGASVYVERYFTDNSEFNNGNPLWPRTWTLENIASSGGLTAVDKILEGDERKVLLDVGEEHDFQVEI